MKNIRFYTIAVLFDRQLTPKVNRCFHMDIRYSTFDIGSHVISCLREYIKLMMMITSDCYSKWHRSHLYEGWSKLVSCLPYAVGNHFEGWSKLVGDIWCSGVVRRSAAWGENKKCRPCPYFIWILDQKGSSNWLFRLPKIWIWFKWDYRSFGLQYFTNQLLYLSRNHPPTLALFGNFNTHRNPSN